MNVPVYNYSSEIIMCAKKASDRPLVVVRCLAYNHEAYIHETLEGFVKQKTTFPFIISVHDDASTDATVAIISKYAKKYPDLIKPYFERENQYSKHDGSLSKVVDTISDEFGAKYIALCEGDDYWIDPYKLQKQVDFLESHPEYSLVATNVINKYPDREVESKWNTEIDRDLTVEEIVLRGGLFLATASLVFRQDIYDRMPEKAKSLHVGDYPIQIFMASQSKVRLLADITCKYRIESNGSWSQRNRNQKLNIGAVRQRNKKEIYLLDVMNEVTEYKYSSLFQKRKNIYLYNSMFLFSAWHCFKAFIKDPITIVKFSSICHVLLSFLPQKVKRKLFAR